jgi:hypothetical protein
LEESYCVCYRLLNRRSDFVSACLPACRDALLHISSAARCIVCCDMIFFEGVCSCEGHARFSLSGHLTEAPSGFCEVGHFVSDVAVAVGGQCDQEEVLRPARSPAHREAVCSGCYWLSTSG